MNKKIIFIAGMMLAAIIAVIGCMPDEIERDNPLDPKGTAYAGDTNDAAVTYEVIYHGNGHTSGTVPTDNNEYDPGDNVIVMGNTGNLSNNTKTFAGWTNSAGSNFTGAAIL